VAETPTSLARYILDAGVRALIADMRTDVWINEAVMDFRSKYPPNGIRARLLESGVPPKVLEEILVLAWQRYRMHGDQESHDVDGNAISVRLHQRYSEQLSHHDVFISELDQLQNDHDFPV
jgi:hypothetical protein